MKDIVERLRDYGEEDAWSEEICKEAADEIERLRSIEAAYNNIVQAERDLQRVRGMETLATMDGFHNGVT